MQSLPQLGAVEFRKQLETGVTKPCVFQCEDSKGKLAGEYATKLRASVSFGEVGLQYEFIAWQLADYFGIPQPPAALINIDDELADTIENRDVRENVKKSVGLNFGTKFVVGFSTWIPGTSIPLSLQRTAAEIVAFDALVENPDRQNLKPNILLKGDEFLILDHEKAFAFVNAIGLDLNTWDKKRFEFLGLHLFHKGLKGKSLDLKDFALKLKKLDNQKISKVCDTVPREFGAVDAKIPAHLKAARENATTAMSIIQEIFK